MRRGPGSQSLLAEQECWRLLDSQRVGRVAFTVDALPAVLPVSYRLIDGLVVFFVGEERKLIRAVAHAVIAFEVDMVDSDGPVWSVTAVGEGLEVTDGRLVEAVNRMGRVFEPAGGSRLLALRPSFVSGRRF